jgi:hypothetical protein
MKWQPTYLYSRLERQESIAGIAHFENAAKPILGEVADLENLKIGGHGAQVEFADEDIIDNDGRFGRLVQGRREQVACSFVELGVGRERRPVEVEGHVEMAIIVRQPWEEIRMTMRPSKTGSHAQVWETEGEQVQWRATRLGAAAGLMGTHGSCRDVGQSMGGQTYRENERKLRGCL